MTPNPQAYAEACRLVDQALATRAFDNQPCDFAYLMARAAFLQIKDKRGTAKAAELAHALGHELNGGAP